MISKAALKKLMAQFSISEEDAKELGRLAHEVWDNIAFDVLSETKNHTCSKAEVVEMVLDADRLRSKVMQGKNESLKVLFSRNDRDQNTLQTALVQKAFPQTRWGL